MLMEHKHYDHFQENGLRLGVINTFDPIIFGIHVVGLLFWMFGANPVPTFLIMYAIIFVYYILRFAVQNAVKNSVKHTIPDADEIIVAPTMKFFQWRVAAISKTHHYVGRAYGRSITIYDKFENSPYPNQI